MLDIVIYFVIFYTSAGIFGLLVLEDMSCEHIK